MHFILDIYIQKHVPGCISYMKYEILLSMICFQLRNQKYMYIFLVIRLYLLVYSLVWLATFRKGTPKGHKTLWMLAVQLLSLSFPFFLKVDKFLALFFHLGYVITRIELYIGFTSLIYAKCVYTMQFDTNTVIQWF